MFFGSRRECCRRATFLSITMYLARNVNGNVFRNGGATRRVHCRGCPSCGSFSKYVFSVAYILASILCSSIISLFSDEFWISVEAKKVAGSTESTVAMVIIRSNEGLAIPHSMLPIVPVATSHASANCACEKPFLWRRYFTFVTKALWYLSMFYQYKMYFLPLK